MKTLRLFFVLTSLVFLINFISSVCEDGQIDINSASKEDLMKITGLGGEGVIAQRVIDARPFNSVDDLTKVSGIKEAKLASIKSQNLACVSVELKTEEKKEENVSYEKNISNKDVSEEPVIENISSLTTTGRQTIDLNPKAIKSDTDSQVSDRGSRLYWLFAFAILLGLLFLIKGMMEKRRKRNEFA